MPVSVQGQGAGRRILHQVAGIGGHPVGVLAVPLDIAADGIGQGHAQRSSGQMITQGAFQIVNRYA